MKVEILNRARHLRKSSSKYSSKHSSRFQSITIRSWRIFMLKFRLRERQSIPWIRVKSREI